MVNNASAVLGVVQRDVLGLHRSVNMLTSGFTAAKEAAAGLSSVLSRGAVLGGLDGLACQQVLVQEQWRNIPTTSLAGIAGTGTSAAAGALTTTNQAGHSDNFGDVLALLGPFGRAPVVPDNLKFGTKASPGARIEDRLIDLMSTLATTDSLPELNSATILGATTAEDGQNRLLAGSDFLNAFRNGYGSARDWSSTFVDAVLPRLLQSPNASDRNISPVAARDQHPVFQESISYARRDGQPGTETSALEWRTKANLLGNHDSQQLMTRIATQQARFQTDPSLNRSASGMGAYDALAWISTDRKSPNTTGFTC